MYFYACSNRRYVNQFQERTWLHPTQEDISYDAQEDMPSRAKRRHGLSSHKKKYILVPQENMPSCGRTGRVLLSHKKTCLVMQ